MSSFPSNGEGWFETNLGYSASDLVKRLKKARRHNKSNKGFLDAAIEEVRMLKAMDYTTAKRPEMVDEVSDRLERGEEVVVPSYQVVNNLRLAEEKFEGREEEFQELESKVFEDGIGRVTFKREMDGMLTPRADGPGIMETQVDRVQPEGTPELGRLIERLKDIQKDLGRLGVSRESGELFSQLLDSLEAEKV